MPRVVDSESPTPVRVQLRSILLEEIESGVYPPNQRIPSERDLAERHGASRASIRETIAELISSGVLFRAGGRGTFVAETRAPSVAPQPVYQQVGFWISAEIFHFVQAGYTRILTGVEDVCRNQGCSLAFHSFSEEQDSLDRLLDDEPKRPLAGHIVAGGLRNSALERLQRENRPLVLVDPLMRRKQNGIDCVRIDYAKGAREAVHHLVELGHREIGFVGFANTEKYEGYWRALEDFGIAYNPRSVQFLAIPDLAPSVMVGFQCMNQLVASGRRPTAVLVANDYIALGALPALEIAGIRVPDEMSIAGFDDIGEGALPLTTVRCDLVETGRIAARRLFDRLQNPEQPAAEVVVPVELVVRRSTAPAAQSVAR